MALPTRPPGGFSRPDEPENRGALNHSAGDEGERAPTLGDSAMPSLDDLSLPPVDFSGSSQPREEPAPQVTDHRTSDEIEDDDWDSILNSIGDEIYEVAAEEQEKNEHPDEDMDWGGDQDLSAPDGDQNYRENSILDDWENLYPGGDTNGPESPTDSQIPNDDDWDTEGDEIDDWSDLDEDFTSEEPREEGDNPTVSPWDEEPQKFPEIVENDEKEADDLPEDEEESDSDENYDEELEEEPPAPLRKSKKSPKQKSQGLVGSLAGIPFLGIIFKPLLGLGKLVSTAILAVIPIAIIALVIYLIAMGTAPKASGATGPDNSAVTVSDVTIDGDEISAIVHNEGDVIANVTVELERWTYDPFGGGNIFKFQKQESCSVEVTVAIDESETAIVSCPSDSSGVAVRGGASASF